MVKSPGQYVLQNLLADCGYPSQISGQFLLSTSTPSSLFIKQKNQRWDYIRSTEGWAGLQHHSVLRTTLTVHPPEQISDPPRLMVDLIQGSFFTILPLEDPGVPKWYSGDVYAIERAIPRSIELPTPPSLTLPTTYNIFVSGDYEVRKLR